MADRRPETLWWRAHPASLKGRGSRTATARFQIWTEQSDPCLRDSFRGRCLAIPVGPITAVLTRVSPMTHSGHDVNQGKACSAWAVTLPLSGNLCRPCTATQRIERSADVECEEAPTSLVAAKLRSVGRAHLDRNAGTTGESTNMLQSADQTKSVTLFLSRSLCRLPSHGVER